MNCKQVQEILPLFVGGDLDEKRDRLASAHLQSCAECMIAAGEYRETRQLLQGFTPPSFSEGVYAEIRQRVWSEIEAESTAPALPQLIASLFRPRLAWTVASALLIAVLVFAIYFIPNRPSDQGQLANKRPTAAESPANDQPDKGPQSDKQTPLPLPEAEAGDEPQRANVDRAQRRKPREVVRNRAITLAANASAAKSTTKISPQTSKLPESKLPTGDSAASEKTLRVEIQTSDPNIRIIWFTPRETKPVAPNSKGI